MEDGSLAGSPYSRIYGLSRLPAERLFVHCIGPFSGPLCHERFHGASGGSANRSRGKKLPRSRAQWRKATKGCSASLSILRRSAFILVVLLLLPKILLFLNIRAYEIAERGQHWPKRKGHHMWHNVYIGVGATVADGRRNLYLYNHENIPLYDPRGVYAVKQALPYVVGYPEAYDQEIKNQYLTMAWKNPNDLFKAGFSHSIISACIRDSG